MSEKYKRKWGDRKDGRRIHEHKGLQAIMPHLMPKRTEAEVWLQDKIDITELLAFMEKRNEEYKAAGKDYKLTMFHCFCTAVSRMLLERPLLNRFIQGRKIYERFEISLSFTAKRRFEDHAEEALMVLKPQADDTLDTISKKIAGDVHKMRKSEVADGGIDGIMTTLAKLPMPVLAGIVGFVRKLDFFGHNLDFLTEGDPNYTTVLLSNLGSIKCPSIYHHLNNYGTNSIMVTIGTIHKEEVLMADGHKEIRDILDFGATLDERIGDGFYFARSLKLIHYIFAHPELLDRPLREPSGYEYK